MVRFIAVDPGYDRVGIAVFEESQILYSTCYSPQKGSLYKRLFAIREELKKIIAEYQPTSLALETLFFSKNQKTALQVAEARGVIAVTALGEGLSVHEYSPQAVKIAVTGSGNAAKAGVIKMIGRLVTLPEGKRLDDEYDAIALGIAHGPTAKRGARASE